MIGIGTIGRAAESGGSTTYQNGQYIAIDIYDYNISPAIHTLYFSDNFGATFKTRTLPLPDTGTSSIYINYLGEIMIKYTASLYYAASFTSSWVLIEDQHKSSKCEVSWDFNTIIYARAASGGSGTIMPLYISRNKGISFIALYLSGTPTVPYNIDTIRISGDGSKAYIIYEAYSSSSYDTKVCLVNLTTGSVIYYGSHKIPAITYTNYYGDYCGMYAYNESAGVNYQTGILHNNNFTFFTSKYGYAFIGENGWGVEYNSSSGLRFFSTPSPYNTIRTYNSGSISSSGIVGDYFYYSIITSGVVYLYMLDKNVGSSPILIKSITGPSATNTGTSVMGVSRVPPTLL